MPTSSSVLPSLLPGCQLVTKKVRYLRGGQLGGRRCLLFVRTLRPKWVLLWWGSRGPGHQHGSHCHAWSGSVSGLCTGSLLLSTDLIMPSIHDVSPWPLLVGQPSGNFLAWHVPEEGNRGTTPGPYLLSYLSSSHPKCVSQSVVSPTTLGCRVLARKFLPPPSFKVQSCGWRKEKIRRSVASSLCSAFLSSSVHVSPCSVDFTVLW